MENTRDNKPTENEKTAKMAGAGAGALAGAQLGTVLLPVPVIGTFSGALVGGLVGTRVGKKVGGAILDKFDASSSATRSQEDLMKELEQLSQMKEAGIIDEEEFKAAKARLLGL